MPERFAEEPDTRARRATPRRVGVLLAVVLVVPFLPSAWASPAPPAPGSLPIPIPSINLPVDRAPLPPPPAGHDLLVTATNATVAAGVPVMFFARLGNGSFVGRTAWSFGDGTTTTSSKGLVEHVYAVPGLFAVQASAADPWGTTHDDRAGVLIFPALSSFAGDVYGTHVSLVGRVTSNTTPSSVRPTALISAGGEVTVLVREAGSATNPQSVVGAPSFSAQGGSHASLTVLPQGPGPSFAARVDYDLSTPSGAYDLNFSLPTSTTVNGSVVLGTNSFTVTVVVGNGLGGSAPPTAGPRSRGTLRVHELAPGGAATLDPAIAYDTTSAEPITNVYQPLIGYNGTATAPLSSSFVPEIAACVPGTPLCTSLYGSSLVNGPNLTFVIGNTSQFYDPATGVSWGAWPTDVLFSIARTLAFSDLPCYSCNNGWILSQALLPAANVSGGFLHYPRNNTPSWIFASMTLNGSDCPASALTNAHGCITFNPPAGQSTPELIGLLASTWGTSIIPCGWASAPAQGAGIPYWSLGNVSGSGDGPCPSPGTGTFGSSAGTIPASGWDAYEQAGSQPPYLGTLASSMAGSGPYYLNSYGAGAGYNLTANPAYQAPCGWSGCQPMAGSYVRNVSVLWDRSAATGLSALQNGTEELTSVAPMSAGALAGLVQAGLANVREFPTHSLWFYAMNLDWSAATATTLFGGPFNAPATLFADPNLRQFLVHAFPYSAVQSQAFTTSGIQTRFPTGEGFPLWLDNRSASNVSWPLGNPDTNPSDVGGAAWWWNRTTNDNMTGLSCTTTGPCLFPFPVVAGDPLTYASTSRFVQSVVNLSGGAITPQIVNVSFLTLIVNTLFVGPGGNPFPVYPLGWSADYPDPTDFATPLYYPDATYTYGDAVAETLAPYNSSACSTSVGGYSSLTTPIPLLCQGAVYNALLGALKAAAVTPVGAPRTLLYSMAENIALGLGLYVGNGQSDELIATAPWIDPASVSTNPFQNGGGAENFWTIRFLSGPATALSVLGPTPSLDPALATRSLHLTAVAVGGAGGYTYNWTGLPGGCSNASLATVTCIPPSGGNFTVYANVTDLNGTDAVGGPLRLELFGPPVVRSFSASPSTVYLGFGTNFTVAATAGDAPYAYRYSNLPPGCLSQNLSTLPCLPNRTGSYLVRVTVTDSHGLSAGASAPLTVNAVPPAPAVQAFSVTPSVADLGVGLTVSYSVIASRGSPLTISGVPGCGQNDANTSGTSLVRQYPCTPSAVGAFTLTLRTNDTFGRQVTATAPITVNPLPRPLALNLSASVVDVGQTFMLNATVNGGTGPFTYAWGGLPAGCATVNAPQIRCTPTGAGAFTATVQATDTFDQSVHIQANGTVNARPSIPSFIANPSNPTVNTSTVLTVVVAGGTEPFAYAYTGLPAGCFSLNTSTLMCRPNVTGSFVVQAHLTDSLGVSAVSGTILTVMAPVVRPPQGPNGTSSPGFLGLPGFEGYLVLIALVAVIAAALGIVLYRRRSSPPRPPEEGEPGAAPGE